MPATFRNGTTALGGTANSASTTEQEQAHSTANDFAVGDDLNVTLSASTNCQFPNSHGRLRISACGSALMPQAIFIDETPVSSMSAVGSNTSSTTTSIAYPTGIQRGDLLWLQAGCTGNDPMHSPSATPADGFTVLYDTGVAGGSDKRVIYRAKIATGKRPAASR